MQSYVPSLLDKLLGETDPHLRGGGAGTRHSLQQVKQSVVRDIECLLNAHAAFAPEELQGLPRVQGTLLTLGLTDISSLSMASDHDRRRITDALRRALTEHDRRLAHVDVRVREQAPGQPGLAFSIRAQLIVKPNREAVSFDAVLQRGSQRCLVTEAARPVPGAASAPSALSAARSA